MTALNKILATWSALPQQQRLGLAATLALLGTGAVVTAFLALSESPAPKAPSVSSSKDRPASVSARQDKCCNPVVVVPLPPLKTGSSSPSHATVSPSPSPEEGRLMPRPRSVSLASARDSENGQPARRPVAPSAVGQSGSVRLPRVPDSLRAERESSPLPATTGQPVPDSSRAEAPTTEGTATEGTALAARDASRPMPPASGTTPSRSDAPGAAVEAGGSPPNEAVSATQPPAASVSDRLTELAALSEGAGSLPRSTPRSESAARSLSVPLEASAPAPASVPAPVRISTNGHPLPQPRPPARQRPPKPAPVPELTPYVERVSRPQTPIPYQDGMKVVEKDSLGRRTVIHKPLSPRKAWALKPGQRGRGTPIALGDVERPREQKRDTGMAASFEPPSPPKPKPRLAQAAIRMMANAGAPPSGSGQTRDRTTRDRTADLRPQEPARFESGAGAGAAGEADPMALGPGMPFAAFASEERQLLVMRDSSNRVQEIWLTDGANRRLEPKDDCAWALRNAIGSNQLATYVPTLCGDARVQEVTPSAEDTPPPVQQGQIPDGTNNRRR